MDELSHLNSLTITDRSGNSQTLYFGTGNANLDDEEYTLPPLPPAGAFDARFTSQGFVALHPSSLRQSIEYPIDIRSDGGTISVKWSINGNSVSYLLTDASGKPLTKKVLTGSGTVQLQIKESTQLVLKVQANEIPTKFALHQNFPNPFNPTTAITFDLPVTSKVTLKIFNILGQEIATLLDQVEFNAGEQTVHVDASKMTSGVYFYQLEAGSFVSVKKMVLVR